MSADLSSLTKQLERLNDNIEKLLARENDPGFAPMEHRGGDHCVPVDFASFENHDHPDLRPKLRPGLASTRD